MKKWIKVMAIAGAVLFGLGSITALAAMGLGAIPGVVNFSQNGVTYIRADEMEDKWEKWEEDWENRWEHRREDRCSSGISSGSGISSQTSALTISSGQAQSFSPETVRKIEVDLLGGDAELFLISDSQIQVAVDEQAQKRGVFVRQEEGELKIGQQKQKFGRFSDESFGKIQIGIPETMALNELECSVDAGTCTVTGIYAKTMDLSTEVGIIEVRNSKADGLDASADVGSVFYEGVVERNVEGDCGVGELEFHLQGKEEEFNYSLETGIGSVQIGDSQFGGLGMEQQIDNRGQGAAKHMELEVGTGTIAVSFYQ